MRILLACLLLAVVVPTLAQVPESVVAQTTWPTTKRIALLREPCGWPGGALRAQEITATRQVRWGCWGYNETGVQVQWSSGRTDHIDFLELWIPQDGVWSQMGYQRLHQRVHQLKGLP